MSTATVTIRMTNPKDAIPVLRLKDETWLATYPSRAHNIGERDIQAHFDLDPMTIRIGRWRNRLICNDSQQSWVAVAEGQLIGFASAIRGPERNEVKALYILPAFQRAGSGTRMLEVALAWLGERKEVRTYVVEYNQPAIDMFQKADFATAGPAPEKLLILPNGAAMPVIEMLRPANL